MRMRGWTCKEALLKALGTGWANGIAFNEISNGAPGIETLLTILYSEGVARGRIGGVNVYRTALETMAIAGAAALAGVVIGTLVS